MARPVGRPPKPTEQKRRLGNPGKRKLPSAEVAIVGQIGAPEPVRPLGQVGLAFWQRVWAVGFAWISPQTDIELLQMVCEQIDERQALRVRVLRDGDWRDRTALRALDAQVLDCLSLLGFTPVDRARLGFVEVKIQNELDAYRERKAKGGRATKVVDVGEAEAD
ncbi:MAG: phage terminase small subunit P27 family [Betaproteobacteria bacterium]|nr:phage terminase small subunit P27 family [Betaproteobacteria bacterium]